MLAVVGPGVARLKQAMDKEMAGPGSERRIDALPRAVRALNRRPHPRLFDAAPEDVQQGTEQDNTERVRHVDTQAGVDIWAHAKQPQHAAYQLRAAGSYRVLLPKHEWPRVDRPRWSSEEHQVQSVRGGYVTDTIGERTPLRLLSLCGRPSLTCRLPKLFVAETQSATQQ